MSEPLHPPYSAGALSTPRQLQRWLDTNAQNGSLTRTRKYLLVPAFQITGIDWRGFSEIVAEFHLTASNNFSLRDIPAVSNPAFTLCIAYVTDDGETVRYRLWSSDNEVIYFTIPEYEGQPINSTFKIEVWSTDVVTIIQDTAVRIDTSVLGDVDYRYGVDEELVVFSDACVGQGIPIDVDLGGFELPLIFNVCDVTGGGFTFITGERGEYLISEA